MFDIVERPQNAELGRTFNGPLDGVALPSSAQPGTVGSVLGHAWDALPDDMVRHLATHYGTTSHEVVALGLENPALLERVHRDGPDIWTQVEHARRTTVMVRGLDSLEVRSRVSELLAS